VGLLRVLERSLDRVREAHWERLGILMGLLACVSIGSQVVHELASPVKSTLSWPFLSGFAVAYGFWFLYGLRFRRLAIWLPNGVAALLQLALALVAVAKSAGH